MKKLHSILTLALFNISSAIGMQQCVPTGCIQDISEKIIFLQISDVHNQVTTPEEARDYLVSASLVNQQCYKYVNNPIVIRTIINNLQATLVHLERFHYFKEELAEKLNTIGSKNYIEQSIALFSEHLTTNNVQTLLNKGADPNYNVSISRRKTHNPKHYHVGRFDYSTSPLLFYASGATDSDVTIAQLLLENGALINKEINDNTPLQVAVYRAFPKMVALLLSYKPHLSNDTFDDNLLSQAIKCGNTEIINLLQNYLQRNCSMGLKAAIEKRNPQLIQELFDHGAQPEHALQEVVQLTLKKPADQGLPTTEILQLFCNNGIKNEQLLQDMITQTKEHIARGMNVLALLQEAHRKEFRNNEPSDDSDYDDVPDLIPSLDYQDDN